LLEAAGVADMSVNLLERYSCQVFTGGRGGRDFSRHKC
jgi:hypothetical protein